MPTVMTHSVAGLGLGRLFTTRRLPFLFWELVIVLPMVPDADVLAFKFGIPYAAMLGHRGLSHSLVFAAGLGLGVAALTYRRFGFRFWDLWGFFSC